MTGNAERPLSREFNRFQPGPPNRGGLILPLIDDRLWPGRCKAAVRACCGPSSALSALRGMRYRGIDGRLANTPSSTRFVIVYSASAMALIWRP